MVCTAFFSISCNPFCRQGSGPAGEESRVTDSFTSVETDIPVTVIIRKGPSPELKIVAQENIRELITTRVSNGKLHIEANKCYKTEEPIRIEIRTAELSKIELSGSGRITVVDTFQTKEASIEISGSGNIEARMIASSVDAAISGSGTVTLIGSANELNIELSGSGGIEATAMPCNKADVEVSGSGNIHIYALEKLKAAVAGSGNIYYKGNPDVKSNISGSGKVVSNN